ncbi:MAG: hypothetical protein FJ275_04665, partial [Planctomycetes bacterium]|nr:hypothetical protein [Planctomycetota bacterium]
MAHVTKQRGALMASRQGTGRFSVYGRIATCVAVVLVGLATCSDAMAQTRGSWNVDADGLWSLNTNWLNNMIAGGISGTATFANNITATRTVNLDTARSLGSFIFGDADTSSAAS